MGLKKMVKMVKKDRKILDTFRDIRIPSSIFRNTPLSILEAIVDYLKTDKGLNFHQIGMLLGRDERNIWTIYHRTLNKK